MISFDCSKLARQPLFLNSTRARRTYTGGKNIEIWQGKPDPKDSNMPEEWVASTVEARNPGFEKVENEGLSTINLGDAQPGGCRLFLKDVLQADPDLFLGRKHAEKYGSNMGVLVKIIDSLERLTIQVHPDKKFAREVFNSDFGKTEAWYILGSREEMESGCGSSQCEESYLLFGFKPGITRERWKKVFDDQNIPEMLDCLHKIKPKPGDVFLIEGGVPHAIGPGCFLVEIQEPTDFTLRTERTTPTGNKVPDMLIHQGAGFEKLMDGFHYEGLTLEETMRRWKIAPKVIYDGPNAVERVLVDYDHTPCFRMHEVIVRDRYVCEENDTFSVLVIIEGNGKISWESVDETTGENENENKQDGLSANQRDFRQSDEIFLPASLGKYTIENTGDKPVKILKCYPPA